jgi:hypothetical protein
MPEPVSPDRVPSPDTARQLREAIESLIDAKLLDLVAKSGGIQGGLDRLLASRRSGVSSFDIRLARRNLDEALTATLPEQERAGTA